MSRNTGKPSRSGEADGQPYYGGHLLSPDGHRFNSSTARTYAVSWGGPVSGGGMMRDQRAVSGPTERTLAKEPSTQNPISFGSRNSSDQVAGLARPRGQGHETADRMDRGPLRNPVDRIKDPRQPPDYRHLTESDTGRHAESARSNPDQWGGLARPRGQGHETADRMDRGPLRNPVDRIKDPRQPPDYRHLTESDTGRHAESARSSPEQWRGSARPRGQGHETASRMTNPRQPPDHRYLTESDTGYRGRGDTTRDQRKANGLAEHTLAKEPSTQGPISFGPNNSPYHSGASVRPQGQAHETANRMDSGTRRNPADRITDPRQPSDHRYLTESDTGYRGGGMIRTANRPTERNLAEEPSTQGPLSLGPRSSPDQRDTLARSQGQGHETASRMDRGTRRDAAGRMTNPRQPSDHRYLIESDTGHRAESARRASK